MKIILLLILNFANLVLCYNFKIGQQGSRTATFDRFNGTCGLRNLTVVLHYQGMRYDGDKLYMNCTSTVKDDILNDPTLIIKLERCKNRENLDTCEQFYDMKKDKSCILFDKHNPLWGPFFTAFEPEFKCPVKKGVYRARNGELDASAFLLFPQDTWVWKVKIELYEAITDRLLMCFLVEATIVKQP